MYGYLKKVFCDHLDEKSHDFLDFLFESIVCSFLVIAFICKYMIVIGMVVSRFFLGCLVTHI